MRNYKENIKNNLPRFRKAKGISKSALARAVDVKPASVTFWENGDNLPTLETFFKICDVLGVSADQLAGRDSGVYLSEEDREVLEAYHNASDAEKPLIRRTLGIPEELGEWESNAG